MLRLALALWIVGVLPACSSNPGGAPKDAFTADASMEDAADGSDAGVDAMASCEGLQCQALADACSAHGDPTTTITGTVYDPAGALPLPGVYVYIPNAPLDPITAGTPSCTQCPAPASGSPLIGALTDRDGRFTLVEKPGDPWGVPSGTDIPLVLQVGKWRRQITIPSVAACASNTLPDPATPADKLRLPAKGSEGDLPLIAVVTGCDPSECFLRKVGIDDSEFVAPGSTTGHVHVYTGQDAASFDGGASKVTNGNAWTDTYAWWESAANLEQYDLILLSCECDAFSRTPAAEAAMQSYVTSGGRLLAMHDQYNWFAPPTGPTDFQGVASWALPEGVSTYANYYVSSAFPRGQMLADWLEAQHVTTTPGQLDLTDARYDVNAVIPPTSAWIYNADSKTSSQTATTVMSFNVPVGPPSAAQCGRVVYSDAHIAGASDDSTFPNECPYADPGDSHAVNRTALEFMFFDLSSCVQDDSLPQVVPPAT